ncbi:hypothetical protein Chor_008187, partial [Crotalus horridus]
MAASSPAVVPAAPENESGALATKPKSPAITPQKVRELIDEGIAPEEAGPDRKDHSVLSEVANGSPDTNELPFEATSKDAFFSRYGWTNVECDMLKCSSCQAYLCANKERCLALQKALLEAHEKFCFWPDSPSPGKQGERNSQVGSQLDTMLASQALTEEKVSFLLQLIEEEQQQEGEEEEEKCKTEGEKTSAKRPLDLLHVHITACILALCGWTSRSVEKTESGKAQHEKSPSPVSSRTRGGDSYSERPEAEATSPTTRSRPVTRSMGHGDDSMTRVYLDPLAQHRDWCPWVNEVKEATVLGTKGDFLEEKADRGWQVVMKLNYYVQTCPHIVKRSKMKNTGQSSSKSFRFDFM